MDELSLVKTKTIARKNKLEDVVKNESGRLLGFIKKQVDSLEDAEDILQDVFAQYASNSIVNPIEQATAWLYTVARNKITDLFRKKRPLSESSLSPTVEEKEFSFLMSQLLSENNPEMEMSKSLVMEELEFALNELPFDQKEAFILHEIEGKSFKEMSIETGASVNTLISRKRYAVLHLRQRLQSIYNEFLND